MVDQNNKKSFKTLQQQQQQELQLYVIFIDEIALFVILRVLINILLFFYLIYILQFFLFERKFLPLVGPS